MNSRISTPLIASSRCFKILSIRSVRSLSLRFSFYRAPMVNIGFEQALRAAHFVELGPFGYFSNSTIDFALV